MSQKKISISFNLGQWDEVVSFLGHEPSPAELKALLVELMNIQTPDGKAGRPKSQKLVSKKA